MPKKFGKQQNQSQFEPSPLLFTMGELDLIFKIDFKEEDLEKEESESKNDEKESNKEKSSNYYKLEDINNLKDLSFIKDNEELWDRIKLKPGNDNIKLLLIGNKNAKTKVRIEYICFGRPKFEEDTEFFEEIFEHVTNKNGLLINKTPLDEGGRFSLKIEMRYGKETKTIQIGSTVEESKEDKEKDGEENKNKEEENKEDNPEEEEEEEEEEDDYEENEAMQQKRIPKFKRSKSVLCNLEPTSSKYNMVYLNYEDFSKIPGNFKIGDMIELITHFKKKNSTIFINYYKREVSSQSEQEDEKVQNTETNNKKKSRNISEIHKEKEEDPKEKEKDDIKENKITETKKSNNNKEEAKNKEQDKKVKKKELIKEIKNLNKLYYITDIYFFDSEQAVKLFNIHYKVFTKDESRKTITKSKLYDYFIKGIATGTEDEVHGDKAGLFLDEFNKFLIVRASKKSANKKEYDSQPYPKVNHKNLKQVTEYKEIIKKNKDECYTLFISSLVLSMASGAPKCLLPEIIYPSYLIGVELVKRRIECIKNNMAIPNEDAFYKVKINLKALSKELEKFAEDDKESGFILDCTNKNKSTKKEYVSLYDYNLRSFFSNQKVRKDLKDKGFINSKGFIMYDPV